MRSRLRCRRNRRSALVALLAYVETQRGVPYRWSASS